MTKTDYHGLVHATTNAKLQTRTESYDALGQLRQVQDAKNGLTQLGYEPFGQLSETIDPNGHVIKVSYDGLGRRTDLRDPNLGWIHEDVDPMGQIWRRQSPNQRAAGTDTRSRYDLLGRMTARYESDLESHWVYDTAPNGIGKLAEAFTGPEAAKDYQRALQYDNLGRLSSTTLRLDISYKTWATVRLR
jgi:YD repeat-containing protein